jgi:hypothetical protein
VLTPMSFVVFAETLTCPYYGPFLQAGRGCQKATSLFRELWVDGCLGLKPERLGSRWLKASAIGVVGGLTLAKDLHDWGSRAVPLWTFSWHLPQAADEEKHGKHQSGKPNNVDTNRCVDLAALLGAASTDLLSISPPRLPVGDFSQPLVGTSAFQFAELRGSPHQVTLSENSQLVLWCGRRRTESPNPRGFACYQRTKVR